MNSNSSPAIERRGEGSALAERVARFDTDLWWSPSAEHTARLVRNLPPEAVPDALAVVAARKGRYAAEAVLCAL